MKLYKIAQWPVMAYRIFISPWLGPRCRFVPTCSSYALEALERHGALKGSFLTAKRLLKCHPFCRCERHDPVPEKYEWAFDWQRLFRYNRLTRKS